MPSRCPLPKDLSAIPIDSIPQLFISSCITQASATGKDPIRVAREALDIKDGTHLREITQWATDYFTNGQHQFYPSHIRRWILDLL